LCDEIAAKTNFKSEVFADPQFVRLPFVVEERIVSWELQGYTNALLDDEGGSLTDALGGEQFFFTVYIKLRKLKTKKKTAGGFRIVAAAAGGAAAMNVNP
jgi:hypothetical protein